MYSNIYWNVAFHLHIRVDLLKIFTIFIHISNNNSVVYNSNNVFLQSSDTFSFDFDFPVLK